MSPEKALKEARLLGQSGQFLVRRHALQRMAERRVNQGDIASALKTAKAASVDGECWRLSGGIDLDGDPLIVVVVFAGRGLIVTVI